MNDKKITSANKGISVMGTKPASTVDLKGMLGGVSKNVKQRWVVVMCVGAVGILGSSMLFVGKGKQPVEVPKSTAAVDTTPKGITSDRNWKETTGAELLTIKNQLQSSQKAQNEMMTRMEAMQRQLQQTPQQQPVKTPAAGAVDLTLPAPPTPPKSLVAPPTPPSAGAVAPSVSNGSVVPQVVAPVTRAPARAFYPASQVKDKAAEAQDVGTTDMEANEHQGYLPASSFADATLLSGVEAFTGGTAQSQPQPIVMRLNANAVLPNAAHYQIKGCNVLASVWGDLSSERVFGRLVSLSCVDAKNKLVLSEDVEGVLVDSDGKNGIRGTYQDRQGAKLARSLLAGFAQGVAQAFGSAQSTVTSTALGSTSTILGADAARAAGYTGASTAAQQLAQFYLKQAEATMPVIVVDAGRKVNVLFTKSKALHFESIAPYKRELKKKITVEGSN